MAIATATTYFVGLAQTGSGSGAALAQRLADEFCEGGAEAEVSVEEWMAAEEEVLLKKVSSAYMA